MKHRWSKALAFILTVMPMALSEGSAAAGDADDESIEAVEIGPQAVESTQTEPVAEEAEAPAPDDPMDSPAGEEPAA